MPKSGTHQVAAASGFAMLQLQVNVSNSSSALEEDDILMDVLMQQQAFVAKSWASVVEVAQKSEVHIPLWTMIGSLVLLGVLLFYLVNYMLAAQRERSQRQHDLEDAKKHSEHGNMLGSLIEARQTAIFHHFNHSKNAGFFFFFKGPFFLIACPPIFVPLSPFFNCYKCNLPFCGAWISNFIPTGG